MISEPDLLDRRSFAGQGRFYRPASSLEISLWGKPLRRMMSCVSPIGYSTRQKVNWAVQSQSAVVAEFGDIKHHIGCARVAVAGLTDATGVDYHARATRHVPLHQFGPHI